MDRALRLIAAEAGKPRLRAASGGRKKALTADDLLGHARRFGTEAVLVTAAQIGFDDAALVMLAEDLDNIRVRAEGRYATPMNGAQLRKEVDQIPKYLGVVT